MFWENISSHTHAFFLLYSMLWGKISKNQVFSLKNCFFQNFDWSNLIFDQLKSCFKNSMSLCLVRLIEPVFWSIKHRVSAFLKRFLWLIQTFFQKFFSNFSSLSDLARQHYEFVLSFSSSIFARFSSLKVGKTILFLLLFLFSYFHAYFHAFKGYFWTFWNLGIFVDSRLVFWNWWLDFVGILLYLWLLLTNLINLGFYDELKILGFILDLIWGFCSIELKLTKLACCFDVIDHSN